MGLVSTLMALVAIPVLSLADIFTLSIGDIGQYSASLVCHLHFFGVSVWAPAKQLADSSTNLDRIKSDVYSSRGHEWRS
jgi:hypothetical protein